MTEPVIIKKYANRRLYNTDTSSYITLEDLSQMVKAGRNFEVVDAKTGEDMTRGVLAQIIFEQESKGTAMLPINFMRQIIQFYDHALSTAVPHYLETAMDAFSENQQSFQQNTQNFMGPFGFSQSLETMEKIRQQNMEILQKNMEFFNPFLKATTQTQDDQISELAEEISRLEKKLAELKKAS